MRVNQKRHFFGGVAFILLLLQLTSGIFLTLFYEPNLASAYASVQFLYKELFTQGWVRDAHRWLPTFLIVAIVIHIIRSLLRKDFLLPKKVSWLTGSLLLLPLLGILITGFILPWEWKGYWFMEIIPSLFGQIPVIGDSLKAWLIDAFTISRAFVVHVLLLPIIVIILIDFHVLAAVRKRKGGLLQYLGSHGMYTLPFIVAIAVLAVYFPMPTEDPEIIPMPLEGTYVPAPEWFALFFLKPLLYYDGFVALFLSLLLPLFLFLLLALLPILMAGRMKLNSPAQKKAKADAKGAKEKNFLSKLTALRATKGFAVVLVIGVALSLFGPFYAVSYTSPTMGCNSCHNVFMGSRMGVPPKAFKDRDILPLLDDNQWMLEHWYYPQKTW